jgi:hypothetical protein
MDGEDLFGIMAGTALAMGAGRRTAQVDPLLAASTADVQRQLNEARELLREGIRLVKLGGMEGTEDWMQRARSAAK